MQRRKALEREKRNIVTEKKKLKREKRNPPEASGKTADKKHYRYLCQLLYMVHISFRL